MRCRGRPSFPGCSHLVPPESLLGPHARAHPDPFPPVGPAPNAGARGRGQCTAPRGISTLQGHGTPPASTPSRAVGRLRVDPASPGGRGPGVLRGSDASSSPCRCALPLTCDPHRYHPVPPLGCWPWTARGLRQDRGAQDTPRAARPEDVGQLPESREPQALLRRVRGLPPT